MLDAATWEEKEAVPLHIGRRFFRVKGDDQPLPDVGEVSYNSTVSCDTALYCRRLELYIYLVCSYAITAAVILFRE